MKPTIQKLELVGEENLDTSRPKPDETKLKKTGLVGPVVIRLEN